MVDEIKRTKYKDLLSLCKNEKLQVSQNKKKSSHKALPFIRQPQFFSRFDSSIPQKKRERDSLTMIFTLSGTDPLLTAFSLIFQRDQKLFVVSESYPEPDKLQSTEVK